MHSGSSLTPENPALSISIGISALIIEGRPLYDDEYTIDTVDGHQRRPIDNSFISSKLKCFRYPQPESQQRLLGE